MRRNNGEGSAYYDNKRGRYTFRISYTDPVTLAKKRKSFYSKKSLSEAKTKARDFIANIVKPGGGSPPQTVESFLKKWLDMMETVIKPKTWERYKCLIECNISPYPISQVLITELTISDIQQLLSTLTKSGGKHHQGLSASTVNAAQYSPSIYTHLSGYQSRIRGLLFHQSSQP